MVINVYVSSSVALEKLAEAPAMAKSAFGRARRNILKNAIYPKSARNASRQRSAFLVIWTMAGDK